MADAETVARTVFYSEHVNDDGSLKASAISTSDIERQSEDAPAERGFSMNRVAYMDAEVVIAKAVVQQGRKPGLADRAEAWSYLANVSALRAIRHNDEQALCIVDRAEPADRSHAEAWGSRSGRARAELKAIRHQMIQQFRRDRQVA